MTDPLEDAYKEAVVAHQEVGRAKKAYEAAAAHRKCALTSLRVDFKQSYHRIAARLGLTHGRVIQIIKGKQDKNGGTG